MINESDRFQKLLEAMKVAEKAGNTFMASNIKKVIKQEYPDRNF
jgi:hypothetical protein